MILESLGVWIIDVYFAITLLLGLVAALWLVLPAPAVRADIVRAGLAGLALILVASALPGVPRFSMWANQTPTSEKPVHPTAHAIGTTPVREAVSNPVFSNVERSSERTHESNSTTTESPTKFDVQPLLNEPKPVVATVPDMSVLQALACGWLCAGVVYLARLARGFQRRRRLLREARPAPAWLNERLLAIVGRSPSRARRPPALLLANPIDAPMVVDSLAPKIILPSAAAPANASDANVTQLDAALAHEWAHVRNGDLTQLAFERLLGGVLVAHPLWHWLRAQSRLNQDLLADTDAGGANPLAYASALLEWTKRAHSPQTQLLGLTMASSPSTLERRIRMLLNDKCKMTDTHKPWRQCFLFVLAAIAGVGFSTLSVTAKDPESKPATTKPTNVSTDKPTESKPKDSQELIRWLQTGDARLWENITRIRLEGRGSRPKFAMQTRTGVTGAVEFKIQLSGEVRAIAYAKDQPQYHLAAENLSLTAPSLVGFTWTGDAGDFMLDAADGTIQLAMDGNVEIASGDTQLQAKNAGFVIQSKKRHIADSVGAREKLAKENQARATHARLIETAKADEQAKLARVQKDAAKQRDLNATKIEELEIQLKHLEQSNAEFAQRLMLMQARAAEAMAAGHSCAVRLHFTAAAEAAKALAGDWATKKKGKPRLSVDDRTNTVTIHETGANLTEAIAFLTGLEVASNSTQRGQATRSTKDEARRRQLRDLEAKQLQLDLREAEYDLNAKEKEHHLARQNEKSGLASSSQMVTIERDLRKAEIAVARAKLKLEQHELLSNDP